MSLTRPTTPRPFRHLTDVTAPLVDNLKDETMSEEKAISARQALRLVIATLWHMRESGSWHDPTLTRAMEIIAAPDAPEALLAELEQPDQLGASALGGVAKKTVLASPLTGAELLDYRPEDLPSGPPVPPMLVDPTDGQLWSFQNAVLTKVAGRARPDELAALKATAQEPGR